jgi:hypothetical protein
MFNLIKINSLIRQLNEVKKLHNREESKKKICVTNPLVVVVKRGKNGEISKKI